MAVCGQYSRFAWKLGRLAYAREHVKSVGFYKHLFGRFFWRR